MSFEIIQVEGMAVVRLGGRITGHDIVEFAQAVADQPGFDPDWPRIWDARGVTQVLLDINEAREIRAISKERLQGTNPKTGRTAIVVERDIDRDVADFFRWYLKGRSIRVFDSVDKACAWVKKA